MPMIFYNNDGGLCVCVWHQTYRRLLIFIACRLCSRELAKQRATCQAMCMCVCECAKYVEITYGSIRTMNILLAIYSISFVRFAYCNVVLATDYPIHRWAQSELTSNIENERTKIYIDLSGLCTLAHKVFFFFLFRFCQTLNCVLCVCCVDVASIMWNCGLLDRTDHTSLYNYTYIELILPAWLVPVAHIVTQYTVSVSPCL